MNIIVEVQEIQSDHQITVENVTLTRGLAPKFEVTFGSIVVQLTGAELDTLIYEAATALAMQREGTDA